MKVWLVTVFLLFCLVQFVLWLKDFIVPLPLYLLAGAFLAIASNYQKAQMIFPQLQGKEIITPPLEEAQIEDYSL
jgi:hypothetical protein